MTIPESNMITNKLIALAAFTLGSIARVLDCSYFPAPRCVASSECVSQTPSDHRRVRLFVVDVMQRFKRTYQFLMKMIRTEITLHMEVFLRLKDLHAYGKICESVHKTASANKICKRKRRKKKSARKKDLQHFAVTRKCTSCFVKLQLHAHTK